MLAVRSCEPDMRKATGGDPRGPPRVDNPDFAWMQCKLRVG
jgi:hypothetical protein